MSSKITDKKAAPPRNQRSAKRSARRVTKKKLTPKDLGLVDDVVLSDTFENTKKRFKTVDKTVFGYRVDGNHYGVRISCIHRADVWIREHDQNHIISSYEPGSYLNPPQDPFSKEFDPTGDRLANIAFQAIRALEEWHVAKGRK